MSKRIWIVRWPVSSISASTNCSRKRTRPLSGLKIATAIINFSSCILWKLTFFLSFKHTSIGRLVTVYSDVRLVFAVIRIEMFILLKHSMTLLHRLRWHKILVKLDVVNGLVNRADVAWVMLYHRPVAFIHIFVHMLLYLGRALGMASLMFTLLDLWLRGDNQLILEFLLLMDHTL